MAFKILSDLCTGCGTCESVCKNSAISAGEVSYVIDPDRCTECVGWYEIQKCAEVCPVGAPVEDVKSAN